MTAKIKITQLPDPLPHEILESAIVAISEGVTKLRMGRLKDSALCLLIQQSCATADRPTQKQIKAVLDALVDLERAYLKPKSKGQSK